MKTIDTVRDQARWRVRVLVWNNVEYQIRDQLWFRFGDQVRNQIRDHVRYQVSQQITKEIKNEIY